MIFHRIMLDQMLDAEVAFALREQGHDVVKVADIGMATAQDDKILAKAVEDDRILVTLDEHFGDWIVLPLGDHPGVIRVKACPATTSAILNVLLPFLQRDYESAYFKNRLVIVREYGTRWIETGL